MEDLNMAFNAVPPEYTDEELSSALTAFNDRSLKAMVTNLDYWFGMVIFPLINAFPFAVLFDELKRPCYPVNILIAAEIYKRIHHLSDRELIYKAQTDPAIRFALHLYAYKDGEDIFCRKDLISLRGRIHSWYLIHNQDLLWECGIAMAAKEAEIIHSSDKARRIDTGFIESSMGDMSRTELLHSCIAHALDAVCHLGLKPDQNMEHYLDPNDWNSVSYHDQSTPESVKQDVILHDARAVLEEYKDHPEVSVHPYYLLLKRAFTEQAIVLDDGSVRFRTGKDEGMDSQILLNPSDPDATYRTKAGEGHKGYSGLIVDQDEGPKTIRIFWEYQVNITADPMFLEFFLRSLPDQPLTDSPNVLVGDGLFASQEAKKLAASKNLVIITTDLAGKKPNMLLIQFEYSEDRTQIIKCPAGFPMESSSWNMKSAQMTAHLEKGHCDNCPFRKDCPVREQKKTMVVRISKTALERAESWDQQTTSEDYSHWCRYRNGVECDFSNLRRNYSADELPVRDLVDTRYWYNTALMAINAKQVCKWLANLAAKELKTL